MSTPKRIWISAILIVIMRIAGLAWGAPQVFWASDPVRPDETVLLQGSEFADATVELSRQADADNDTAARPWTAAPVLQGGDSSLKFVIPADWKQGVFACRVKGKDGSVSKETLINASDPWWVQGDEGEVATPGGWLRVFGKSLNFGGTSALRLTPEQGQPVMVKADTADCYAARFSIPKELKTGLYKVAVHNGLGGAVAWRETDSVRIEPPVTWQTQVFNVLELYGKDAEREAARTSSRYQKFADRMEGIQAALGKARENGGGVVYFPQGKYLMKGCLEVPPRTVLKGAGQGLSILWWGENPSLFYAEGGDDPEKLRANISAGTRRNDCLKGEQYGLEGLGLYIPFHYTNAIVATGRFRMNKVLVRVDRMWLFGGAEATSLGMNAQGVGSMRDSRVLRMGNNFQIIDCDIMAAATGILPGRYGIISGNKLAANKTICPLGGQREIVFENNHLLGLTPTAYQNIANYGRHIYYGHNNHVSLYGIQSSFDFTTDESSSAFDGSGCKVNGTRITLPSDPGVPGWKEWANNKAWENPIVTVQGGRGAGQWRNIVSFDKREWVMDRPFDCPVNENSFLVICPGIRRWMLVGNTFRDACWVVPAYHVAVDVVCAENKLYNAAEMLNYGADSNRGGTDGKSAARVVAPNWYVQYLDNEFYEGRTYVTTAGGSGNTSVPITSCTVHRRTLWADDNNGILQLIKPANRDIIVEDCQMRHPLSRITVGRGPENVLLRNNKFSVFPATGYQGEGLANAVILPPKGPAN